MGEQRARLVVALNYLEEQGDLILKASGLRHSYRVLNLPGDFTIFAGKLAERFLEAERRDIRRIKDILELSCSKGCIVRNALGYLGEELGRNCGHCDRCLGKTVLNLLL